ncbi:putative membrane protein, TIGR04086 family [Oceanobacillus limi]|uniref:Putative membrane protein, TIGR04086 family n=1 Tax=Oceanobacillus limi TaxID=930131 RepID=A0A1I0HFS1_9BACI|nr:TIGR04086 family membrane protein [Oceanobacillus limi]SET82605.1 putative membrane protein, TIGR04086 family [Oceanobacillus limi]
MQSKQFVALMYGWIVILGLILISSFSLALLLRFSSFNEPALSWVTLVIGLISLFLGGLIAGMKGKAKGWLIGLIVGLGFTIFTFLVQYLGYQQSFSVEQSIHHLFYTAAALFGGIIGVNSVSDENSNA